MDTHPYIILYIQVLLVLLVVATVYFYKQVSKVLSRPEHEDKQYKELIDKLHLCINEHPSRSKQVLPKKLVEFESLNKPPKEIIHLLVKIGQEVPSRLKTPVGRILINGYMNINS